MVGERALGGLKGPGWVAVALASASMACPRGPGADTSGPQTDLQDTDTDTDIDTDTPPPDSSAPVIPATLEASCEPTGNALRFACQVTVDPPQPVQIRFFPTDGGAGEADERIHGSDEALGEHEIGLYLMAQHRDYTWVAETLDPGDPVVTGEVLTGGYGESPPRISIEGASSVRYVGTHQPCDNTATALIFDTVTGEVVWYERVDAAGTIGFFDMVQFTEDRTILAETGPSIVEVDLTGAPVLKLQRFEDYDDYIHHDLFKRNGHIYVITQESISMDPYTGGLTLDGFVVFDPEGKEVARWSAFGYLDIPYTAVGDWMHTNTIWVDEAGDVFLSSWSQDSILKIAGDWTDPAFGRLRWAFAGLGAAGFGSDIAADYSAVSDPSFRDQHNVAFSPQGHLSMLDNGHGRALVIDVNQPALTAKAVGEYPAGEPACGPQGTTSVTSNNHVFVGCSGEHLYEYQPGGGEIWHAEARCAEARASVIRWYPLEGW